jgi:hypothetical protein
MIMASGAAMAALAADAITPERTSDPPPIIAGDTPSASEPSAPSAEPVLYRLAVTVPSGPEGSSDTINTSPAFTPTLAASSNTQQAAFRPAGKPFLASAAALSSKERAAGEQKAHGEPAAPQTEPAAAPLDPRDLALAARALGQEGSGDVSKARQDAHPSETKVTGHENASTSRPLISRPTTQQK